MPNDQLWLWDQTVNATLSSFKLLPTVRVFARLKRMDISTKKHVLDRWLSSSVSLASGCLTTNITWYLIWAISILTSLKISQIGEKTIIYIAYAIFNSTALNSEHINIFKVFWIVLMIKWLDPFAVFVQQWLGNC